MRLIHIIAPALTIAMSLGAQTFDGSGTYIVGVDIEAGTYRSEAGQRGLCYWARLSGLSGELSDVIANEAAARGTVIVEISASDYAFKTSDCAPWRRVDTATSEVRYAEPESYAGAVDVVRPVFPATGRTHPPFAEARPEPIGDYVDGAWRLRPAYEAWLERRRRAREREWGRYTERIGDLPCAEYAKMDEPAPSWGHELALRRHMRKSSAANPNGCLVLSASDPRLP